MQVAATAKLKQVLDELADVEQQIRSILAEIQRETGEDEYAVEGADRCGAHHPYRPAGSVNALVRFDLVRADVHRTGLDVLLSLQFSASGLLVSGDAIANSPPRATSVRPVRRLPRSMSARRGHRTLVPY